MCENFCLSMKSPKQGNVAARKVLFALLLTTIVFLIGYAAFENRPWTVPPEARHVKNPQQPSEQALASARRIYSERCERCHGDSGKGDGRDASLFNHSPSNFTDADQMRSVTDGEMFYKISEGRRPMPSFKDRLSEEQRWQLVLLLRVFAASSTAPGAIPQNNSR